MWQVSRNGFLVIGANGLAIDGIRKVRWRSSVLRNADYTSRWKLTLELSRHLGVSCRTAWLLKHKIMEAMGQRERTRPLRGDVRADER